jgi:hypothetical protein
MAETSIKEQVEQRLQKQQASTEFKDVGRVSQTRKEKSAYKLINGSILGQLEEDGVMAYNMVKKENVWPEIDIKAEKDRGVTSGAVYLKVKLRESVPTRPKDEKAKRATYVLFLELLQKDLIECYNVKQIEELKEKYRSLPMDKIIGYFIDPEFLTADDAKKKLIEEKLKTNTNIRVAFIYGGSQLVTKLVNEVFSARFENTFFNRSDAAHVLWHEAREKEPISEERSKELTTNLLARKEKFIEVNKASIEEYKAADSKQLKRMMDKWRIHSENKKRYNSDIEIFRQFAIGYFERNIKLETERYNEKEKKLKPKDNGWEWFENPAAKTESIKPKSEPINTKAPLHYIKRTGGYKIETITPAEIVEKFGFSAVNYGVYVDDTWSKEHTRHFLGAICDMADILNIDIKQFNELGKLSIAFGAKGRKGHAATYFPQTKDINLTRGNGDGSVAHEWGHYFDNVIIELSEKSATNRFASDGKSPDSEINALFKELMDFFYKGNPLYSPKVPMRFYAKKTDEEPVYFKYISGLGRVAQKIEIKETIEETLIQIEEYSVVDKNIQRTQYRIFGYVIDAFGLEYYDIPMRLKTSYVFHKSAYNYFQYSHKKDDGTLDIVVQPRTKYWTSAVELFARSWETVILKKFLDIQRVSNYLVDDIPMEDIVSEAYFRPYPAGKELEYIETIIDKIILSVKARFNIGNFVPPSAIIEDEYLDLQNNNTGKVDEGVIINEDADINSFEMQNMLKEAISTIKEILPELKGEEKQQATEALKTCKDLLINPKKNKKEPETAPHYIEYLNKKKNFQKDKKEFKGDKGFETAKKWGQKNIPNFNIDMIRMEQSKLKKGGPVGDDQGVDLFEDYENIPADVLEILDSHQQAFEDGDYAGLKVANQELNTIGYTFDYYLDGQAYDLRKIGQKGKAEASENLKNGGQADNMDVKFIEYGDTEIMFEPHYQKYYANDEEFSSLSEAKTYIDKGSPISARVKNAYKHGAM